MPTLPTSLRALGQWLVRPFGAEPPGATRPPSTAIPPGVVVDRDRVDAAIAKTRAERQPWTLDRETWRAEGAPTSV